MYCPLYSGVLISEVYNDDVMALPASFPDVFVVPGNVPNVCKACLRQRVLLRRCVDVRDSAREHICNIMFHECY